MPCRILSSAVVVASLAVFTPALAYDPSGPSPDDPSAWSTTSTLPGVVHVYSFEVLPSPDDPSAAAADHPVARGGAKVECACAANACVHRKGEGAKPTSSRT